MQLLKTLESDFFFLNSELFLHIFIDLCYNDASTLASQNTILTLKGFIVTARITLFHEKSHSVNNDGIFYWSTENVKLRFP